MKLSKFVKKLKLSSALACTAALVMTSQYTQAAFVMTLDDLSDSSGPTVIYDGTGSDFNGVNGVITFSGSVGSFFVNVTTGVSKPTIGPARLDLNSIDVSGAPGTLVVGISDTDFSFDTDGFLASYGGTTDGNVNFSFMLDQNNMEFGGSEFAMSSFGSSQTGTPFSGSDFAAFDLDDLYSLSIMAEIEHGAGVNATSFNAGIAPVPAPGGFLLLASALAGLVLRAKKLRVKK